MSFRKVLFFGVAMVFGLAGSAHAQVGVYGMYTGSDYTGIQCQAQTGVACSSPGGAVKPWGGFGGIYYDFRNVGPVRLGVDLRAGGLHSNRSAVDAIGGANATGAQTFLGGIRGSIHTPISWLSPYAQISAGYTRTDATEPTSGGLSASGVPVPRAYEGFVQYEGFIGADIHVFPFLDVRGIELGIGNMNSTGNSSGTSSVGIKSIGSGVVIRFGHH